MTFNDNIIANLESIGDNSLVKYRQALPCLSNGEPQYSTALLLFYRAWGNLPIYLNILAIN